MPKPVSIGVKIYSLDEACERLAALANHRKPRYSRGGFYRIVQKYKPDLIEPVITDVDLEFLASKLRKPGRPRKSVDKKE